MTSKSATDPRENWISRNGWLLAAMWLVFLVFPWFSILADDDISRFDKAVATTLIMIFSGVYVDGFRRQDRREQARASSVPTYGDRPYSGWVHVAVLVAIGLVLFASVGPAALGLTTFVVAFAIFHFGWGIAWTSLVGGIALALIVPLATDSFDDLWFMAMIVAIVGAAAVLIRGIEANQLRQARLRTQLAVSGERNRVARDVHDVLGHSLTVVIVKAELCQKLLDGFEPGDDSSRERLAACQEQLGELRSVSRDALTEIRATVGGLRATNLTDEITAARTVLADAEVELLVTGDPTLIAEEHRPVLAWVVREAVTNVVRHARSTQCHIEFGPRQRPDSVTLRISDDGVGLGTDGMGNGLRGVHERVEAVGGSVRLSSDEGTTLEVVLR